MHCHGVVLVLVLALSSGSFLAGDHCPECQEIYRKCFVCDIDVSKLKKLEVAKYKPEPPVVEKLYDGNILSKSLLLLLSTLSSCLSITVSWKPPLQWRDSEDHLIVFEFIEEFLELEDTLDEEVRPPFQIRKDLSESIHDQGHSEIVINVGNEKYWNIRACRVRIQADYQVSEFSKEVEVNIRDAKDEKEFFEELGRIVKDSDGKRVNTKDLFGEKI